MCRISATRRCAVEQKSADVMLGMSMEAQLAWRLFQTAPWVPDFNGAHLDWPSLIVIHERIFGGEWTPALYRFVRILESCKLEALADKKAPK